MKICPTCKKSYPDDGLNFCLDDGSVLSFADSDLPETVMMSQPPPTMPVMNPVPPTNPGGPFSQPHGQQAGWDNRPQFSMQPAPRKSRVWLWLLGIFGIGVVLCGGGGILLVGLAYFAEPTDGPGGEDSVAVNGKKPEPSPTASPGVFDKASKIDLAKWVAQSEHGSTSFSDGEFVMASKRQAYYYAMCAAETDKTEDASVRVSLRNIDSGNTSLGYGLIFHSKLQPLQQGYALLIDTTKKRYRVVRHEPKKETAVVKWTNSDAINGGSGVNKIEVRHKNDINELYINDKMVTSVRNIYGFKGGVAGLYVADGIKIGFRDLEIAK